MTKRNLAALCVLGCLLGACSSASAPSGAARSPASSLPPSTLAIPTGSVTPSNFVGKVDNPWFPLTPGTTMIYSGKKEGEAAVQTLEVTPRTKLVAGVPCVVVSDSLKLKGRLSEQVDHYYAQDAQGNVWYFGEEDTQFDAAGKVEGHEGSWQAGRFGAHPGIVMAAVPRVGDAYRQEYYRAHIEDQFTYADLNASVRVPYRSFTNVIRTEETTRLEVGNADAKYYAQGIGLIKELAGDGSEGFELTRITHA